MHPAPPVSAATTAHCLAGRSPDSDADFRRRPLRLLLRPLSPSTAFEARDEPSHAPETNPAAAEVPALVMVFICQVTSLSGVSRRDGGCASALPSRHCLHRESQCASPTISGDRMEKRPLTPQPESFAVRHRLLTDSLASPRGPFVVELFAAGGFSASPRTSYVRIGLSPGTMLPTPARLNEVSDPAPPGRDYAQQCEPHPL